MLGPNRPLDFSILDTICDISIDIQEYLVFGGCIWHIDCLFGIRIMSLIGVYKLCNCLAISHYSWAPWIQQIGNFTMLSPYCKILHIAYYILHTFTILQDVSPWYSLTSCNIRMCRNGISEAVAAVPLWAEELKKQTLWAEELKNFHLWRFALVSLWSVDPDYFHLLDIGYHLINNVSLPS